MDAPIRIFLIDDQAMIRAAFRSLLDRQDGMHVVGDSGDPRDAIALVEGVQPDVVLLDIAMPGLSGIDVIPRLRKVHPSTRILMMTNHEGENFVRQALQEGADGYLSKDSDPQELVLAVRAVVKGNAFVSSKVATTLVSIARKNDAGDVVAQGRIGTLTPREREVFQLLAIGKSNKEVARSMNISLATAKKHRENLQRKLDCHSAAELARLAIQEGLIGS